MIKRGLLENAPKYVNPKTGNPYTFPQVKGSPWGEESNRIDDVRIARELSKSSGITVVNVPSPGKVSGPLEFAYFSITKPQESNRIQEWIGSVEEAIEAS